MSGPGCDQGAGGGGRGGGLLEGEEPPVAVVWVPARSLPAVHSLRVVADVLLGVEQEVILTIILYHTLLKTHEEQRISKLSIIVTKAIIIS